MSENQNRKAEWVKQFVERATASDESPPHCSIEISRDGRSVIVILDTAASWRHEWIQGERGDVGLLRCRDTGRVVGADLPLIRDRVAVWGLIQDADVVSWKDQANSDIQSKGNP